MNEGKVTCALFIDLKKAFDTVNHTTVLQKLASYGVNGNTLSWFSSYLSGRSQIVSVNSTLSDFKDINVGVPQGSILGPLLFIIYVNSLPESVNCKCVMYADDTSLLFTGTEPKSLQSDMNNALSKIASWFDSNMLTLNTKKTKFMVFGTTHLLSRFCNVSVTYGDQVIERVNKFKAKS